jgi:caffeoyl-CoA O-methyltransferase
MAGKFVPLSDEIYDYVLRHGHNRDPLLAELQAETHRRAGIHARMQIDPIQGSLMALLVAASGAQRALEIGTFTGYSALCVARALPPQGHLLCCDVSQEWTAIARPYWERAGVAAKITLKLGPALTTVRALPAQPSFDFAFIDANKDDYPAYYEEVLTRLHPNGLILVDNVLQRGLVVDAHANDSEVQAVRALNERIASDKRVDAVMLPLADGLTIVRKK